MRDKRRLQPHHPEILHVIPLDDTRDHIPFPECWCCPTPDDEYPEVLLHHSADGREDFEEGRRLPS
jgi:hypothetical protein